MILLSELAEKAGIGQSIRDIVDEQGFERFSRTTSTLEANSCVFVSEKKYVKKILQQEYVTMVITNAELAKEFDNSGKGLCIVDNPKLTFLKLLDYRNVAFDQDRGKKKTLIGSNCVISKSAHIYETDVVIGDNVIIKDSAVIYPRTFIGDGAVLGEGVIIGGQDYNFYYEDGIPSHMYHAGSVYIGKNVEIACYSSVGRALYAENTTYIDDDCKVSAYCGIGHDSHIGKRVMIYSGSLVGGNVNVGDDTHITLNCTIKNGITIGQKAMICMGSNVFKNVKDGETVFGTPARKMDL